MKTYFELMVEMGTSELSELESRISVIMQHMLKIDHCPHLLMYNQRIWNGTIKRERGKILELLDRRKPGVKSQLTQELVSKHYKDAFAKVTKEFPKQVFPRICPYNVEQVVGNEVVALLKR